MEKIEPVHLGGGKREDLCHLRDRCRKHQTPYQAKAQTMTEFGIAFSFLTNWVWWFLIPAPGERERLVDPSEILSQKRQREIHVTLYYNN